VRKSSQNLGRWPVMILVATIMALGCGGSVPAVERATSIRFAIELADGVEGPMYVLLNQENDQPGWVRVSRDGEGIYLKERCEVPDCGVAAAVCGAALPFVRDLAGASGEKGIEFVWDLTTSVLDSASRCETRQPAPPGDYVARFCFSREATLEGQGDPTQAVMGRIAAPTCIDKPFTLQEQQVVLTIPADSS